MTAPEAELEQPLSFGQNPSLADCLRWRIAQDREAYRKGAITPSLDHLVSPSLNRRRYSEANRLRGLQVMFAATAPFQVNPACRRSRPR
jgi:hypothetical protein